MALAFVAVETTEQMIYRGASRSSRKIPLIACAVLLHIIGLAVWFGVLRFLALGVALPLVGLSYATIAIGGRVVFGEALNVRKILGIAFIFSGFVMVATEFQ